MAETAEIRAKHRRNLMVLSTLFLLYVATGSSVEDIRNVRVYFISADVSRPEVIICFLWILLGWYFYRFWLSQRGYQAFQQIKNGHMNEQEFIKDYFLKKIIENNPERKELRVETTRPKMKNKRYFLVTDRVLEKQGVTTSWSDAVGIPRELDVHYIKWYFLVVRHVVSVMFSKSTEFWDSIFPFYFAITAMLAGLYRGYC